MMPSQSCTAQVQSSLAAAQSALPMSDVEALELAVLVDPVEGRVGALGAERDLLMSADAVPAAIISAANSAANVSFLIVPFSLGDGGR